jgi:O-antigen/teichoic acid export membrane protein
VKEEITRLGKGTLTYGIGQGLSKLIGFLVLPLLTTYLNPADYGVISMLTAISFLAAPVFGLGLGNSMAVVYFANPASQRKEQTIWTGFVVLLLSSAAMLLAVNFFAGEISLLVFETASHGQLVGIVALSTVFNGIISQPFVFRLQFEEKAKRYVIITILTTMFSLGLTLWMVIVQGKGVWGFMIATLIGNIITFACYFLSVVSWTTVTVRWSIARELMQYGLPMIPSFLFLYVLQNSGRFFLERYEGVADVGIYSIGHTFGMVISLVVTAFTTSWFPYFNSFVNKQEIAPALFGKVTTYYTLGVGGLCVLSFILAKPAVAILTAPAFHTAFAVVGIISLGNFLVGLDSILMAGVYFEKKVYLMNYVQCGAALACVLCNFLLIPEWSVIGTGISFLVGYCFLIVFQIIINSMYVNLRVQYEWRRLGYFWMTAIAAAALSLVPRTITFPYEIALSFFLMLIFLWALYYQLEPGEKQIIVALVRRKNQKPDKLN